MRHLEELCAFRERLVVERDAALAARDQALAQAADDRVAAERRIAELERLGAKVRADEAASRKRVAEVEAECARLDRALEAQERIIAYRQSLRWWVGLPWMRAKLAWKRLTDS
mgnify:CR=1 FL=1